MTKQETNKHTSEENQKELEKKNCTEETPKKFWDIENFKMWIVIISVILIAFYLSVYLCINNAGDRGTFGDTFGAVNALFSGLAFAGMYVALTLQRKEFKLQREEFEKNTDALKSQKEEMTNQKIELEQQKHIMAIQIYQTDVQQFENAFFFMLGQHNKILNSISGLDSGRTTLSGIDFIRYWGQVDQTSFSEYFDKIKFSSTSYVNNLYRIFKYIESSDVLSNENKYKDFDNKQKYFSIVTSVLDYYEMAFIYNYVNTNAYYADFKVLLKKNGLLENMRKTNGRDNSQEFDVKTAKDNL